MINVRSATVEDAVAIATVHIAAWKESYRGIVPEEFLRNLSVERRTAQWVQSLSDSSNQYHRTFVAELHGQVVGFSNYGYCNDPEFGGELYAIYLLKSAQKRGIGRMLVNEVVSGLLNLDIHSMMVWVLKENPARGFYEWLGGKYLRETSIEIGGKTLLEIAYGWRDLKQFQRK